MAKITWVENNPVYSISSSAVFMFEINVLNEDVKEINVIVICSSVN